MAKRLTAEQKWSRLWRYLRQKTGLTGADVRKAMVELSKPQPRARKAKP